MNDYAFSSQYSDDFDLLTPNDSDHILSPPSINDTMFNETYFYSYSLPKLIIEYMSEESTYYLSTCNFKTEINTTDNDFLFGSFKKVDITDFGSSSNDIDSDREISICQSNIAVNINGHYDYRSPVQTVYEGGYNYSDGTISHLHITSHDDEDCDPNRGPPPGRRRLGITFGYDWEDIDEFDNITRINYFGDYLNYDLDDRFECTESYESTTNWWLGSVEAYDSCVDAYRTEYVEYNIDEMDIDKYADIVEPQSGIYYMYDDEYNTSNKDFASDIDVNRNIMPSYCYFDLSVTDTDGLYVWELFRSFNEFTGSGAMDYSLASEDDSNYFSNDHFFGFLDNLYDDGDDGFDYEVFKGYSMDLDAMLSKQRTYAGYDQFLITCNLDIEMGNMSQDHYWAYIDEVDVLTLNTTYYDSANASEALKNQCLPTIRTQIAGLSCEDCDVRVGQYEDSQFHVDVKPTVSNCVQVWSYKVEFSADAFGDYGDVAYNHSCSENETESTANYWFGTAIDKYCPPISDTEITGYEIAELENIASSAVCWELCEIDYHMCECWEYNPKSNNKCSLYEEGCTTAQSSRTGDRVSGKCVGNLPTPTPTNEPTIEPSIEPTMEPTVNPTVSYEQSKLLIPPYAILFSFLAFLALCGIAAALYLALRTCPRAKNSTDNISFWVLCVGLQWPERLSIVMQIVDVCTDYMLSIELLTGEFGSSDDFDNSSDHDSDWKVDNEGNNKRITIDYQFLGWIALTSATAGMLLYMVQLSLYKKMYAPIIALRQNHGNMKYKMRVEKTKKVRESKMDLAMFGVLNASLEDIPQIMVTVALLNRGHYDWITLLSFSMSVIGTGQKIVEVSLVYFGCEDRSKSLESTKEIGRAVTDDMEDYDNDGNVREGVELVTPPKSKVITRGDGYVVEDLDDELEKQMTTSLGHKQLESNTDAEMNNLLNNDSGDRLATVHSGRGEDFDFDDDGKQMERMTSDTVDHEELAGMVFNSMHGRQITNQNVDNSDVGEGGNDDDGDDDWIGRGNTESFIGLIMQDS